MGRISARLSPWPPSRRPPQTLSERVCRRYAEAEVDRQRSAATFELDPAGAVSVGLGTNGAATGGGEALSDAQGVNARRAPRVSVGLPVYNGQDYVAETIISVLDQTWSDFELIVSDNASTDDTAEIVKALAEQDNRIRYRRHLENIGAHRNDNSILPMARGEYFKWTAHDDVLVPTYLEKCVNALDANPEVGLAFVQANVIDENGTRIGELRAQGVYDLDSPYRRLRVFLAENTRIPHVFGVMRRAVLDQTLLLGSYPKSDLVFLYEMAMRTRFARIDEPLLLSREHPSRLGQRPLRERTSWYHPGRRAPMLPRWSQLAGFIRTILRVPMPLADRMQCLAFVAYWGLRHGGELTGDLVYRLRFELGSLVRRTP